MLIYTLLQIAILRFLGALLILLFILHFFHASYAIYTPYQCFRTVNLTLYTVTTIHCRQLKNKIQLETRNSEIRRKLPKDSRPMRNRIGKKKSEEKEQKKRFEEKIVDAPFPVVDAP